ncbi:hypothetical protein [Paucisalibacillus sp. EB02]|uniref:hypothetical protein n=1 Tax=Paucisalibacillus sp. EB02 TaxID=1347087 RepID=UPI0004B5871E|nr:hypothetical protein [Paucisalibacillus sp. EB02]
METKLLLVEGLPGFGKSTTANLLYNILSESKVDASLFLEGNLDHPADYDGVSYFNKSDFENLIASCGEIKEVLHDKVIKRDNAYFLPYREITNEYGSVFPNNLFETIFKNDIYELPLEKNIDLITQRWVEFVEQALNENKTYIFECCFIQNPLTIGMVKYGVGKEKVINYVLTLEKVIEKLNPVLFYIEQDDLDFSFKKAYKERPKEWSSGFIEYYTNQGYGKMKGYKGLEGTIKVLEARRHIENELFDMLQLKKTRINNSQYETANYKSMLIEELCSFEVLD